MVVQGLNHENWAGPRTPNTVSTVTRDLRVGREEVATAATLLPPPSPVSTQVKNKLRAAVTLLFLGLHFHPRHSHTLPDLHKITTEP